MTPPLAKIGLALGSGGWRGLAHIGVIKSLVKHGFQIQAISGSSSGALIGGLYALHQDIGYVESCFANLKQQDLLFAFSDPSAKLGIFAGNQAQKLLEKYTKDAIIEDLPISFAAVATDILTAGKYTIQSGSLAAAIRASGSVPFIFEPFRLNGRMLIDGGAANPIPVDTARQLGADIVIGVDSYASMFNGQQQGGKLSKVDVINLAYHVLLSNLSQQDAKKADLVVCPQIPNLALDPFSKFINNAVTIDQGEIAMDAALPQLRQQMLEFRA